MDEVYLQKVLNGQTEEFGYFIKTYKNLAFNLALSIVKRESDAEDVVQEAFIKAYTFIRSFDQRSKFSSWFYRIVINCAYRHIVTRKTQDKVTIENNDVSIDLLSEELDQFDLEEKSFCIQNALNLISSDESLALHLFYFQDFSIKEISELTNWTPSKTKVSLHRARINLKKALLKVMAKNKITL